ncbi:MAG: arginine--tRNA ligase [Clostridiales bacterium]|jgi:arginyl-tRNA synthetase|nr:arginine--tRNA ligase [Clostridiales bacterium]
MDYKFEAAKAISRILNNTLSTDEIAQYITPAPSAELGDMAFPCFRLAKELKKSPARIANDICTKLNEGLPDFISAVAATGGYLNIFLNRALFVGQTVSEVATRGKDYGRSELGQNRVTLVEYSSPNVAKHFHVGHLGTTIIGHALYNIFGFLGYKTIGLNYLGDWGTQFGKLITAFKKWGSREDIEATGIDGLTKIYVKFHDEADKDASLNGEARAWLLKMQNGDAEAMELWRWFLDLSVIEYQRVYKRLGIEFDSYRGESYYNEKMDAVVATLKEKNLLVESNGAMIVDLSEYKMPPCLILRSDGGTLYPSRDIAAALDRKQTYDFHKSLYVTGMDQTLHFEQWMKVVELMGEPWVKDMAHIPYGLVVFEEGKLSTRKGNVIKMEDLLDEAVAKTLSIIEQKNPDLPDKELVAEQVGLGAVIFNQLYSSRIKDVLFSWDRMLNFEGETGPYVQYTHARACSVLARAGTFAVPESEGNIAKNGFDASLISDEYSFEVAKAIGAFPAAIIEAAEKYEPFLISRSLIYISQAFNKFYHANTIICDDKNLRAARLSLTNVVRQTLKNGLALLGIESPIRM